MAKKLTTKQIEQYEHSDKERANNPHVGLVTPASDPDTGIKKSYQYDPHLDPQLQWAGKAEHLSFDVPTVSLHVHERIDPNTIIETVKKGRTGEVQLSLFEEYSHKPLREAIDFYKHKENWSNRLIAGDSLLVMNSLLEKEGMAGKVQMMYFDPPYGIKYGSNFQPFVNKKDVTDGKDEDLSAEPEMIKAFRDTWELGIHSYLTYLRDRLILARELLDESGSIFIQISDENLHHIKELLDEIFGAKNFITLIPFRKKTMPFGATFLEQMNDFILYYSKNKEHVKYRQLFVTKDIRGAQDWKWFLDKDGNACQMDKSQHETHFGLPEGSRIFRLKSLEPSGIMDSGMFDYEFEGRVYKHPKNGYGTKIEGMDVLKKQKRLQPKGNLLNYRLFLDDFPISTLNASWYDTVGADNKKYVVQTNTEVLKRCILMATDPGDLVLDITCGSGVCAYASEQWGRRWITCDTSRVAITLAKQRLMTANFDYYKLAYISEGVGSGFEYKKVPHITLGSIANNEPAPLETLLDDPEIENRKTRITGPFTVEAVPAPYAKSFDDLENDNNGSDTSIARTGETLRQSEWRDELLKSGVRAKGGNIIHFTRVEPMLGTKFIQATAETKEDTPKKVLVVFGPEHAPLEQRMVENAWQEARSLKPDMLLFCAFQFDEEAAKDIDELTPAIAGMQMLKAQMNADMLTDDLRKKRSSNESFWLVGQPDVKVRKLDKNKIKVEVMGFDYYNPKTGNVESGGKKNIAMWMLDTDYDGRSLFPSQVFFPMAGSGDGWDKLAKNLKAEIDEEKIELFKGTTSLEFEPGNSIAVKIIDDRGIESLRVIKV